MPAVKQCVVLSFAQLFLLGCLKEHCPPSIDISYAPGECDFSTPEEYSQMPPRDGYTKLIMNAKEARGHVKQSIRVVCNPCTTNDVEVEWKLENVSRESIEVFAINKLGTFLSTPCLGSSAHFVVEDSEGQSVKYVDNPWLEAHRTTEQSFLRGNDKCFMKGARDNVFIPLKPKEIFVYKAYLSANYEFKPGKHRVRYRGPFRCEWNTKWVEFEVIEK